MIVTNDLECKVCESVTRVRVQVGWLENYPVNIKCGNCKITIYGNAIIDQQNLGFTLDLKNVNYLNKEEKPDYLIEISGELLTKKIRPFTNQLDSYFSPYIKNSAYSMGDDFGNFQETVRGFLNAIEHDWPTIKRINELWFSGDSIYLKNEIHKVMNNVQFPADNDLELLRAIHILNLSFIRPITGKYFYEASESIFKELKQLSNVRGLTELAQYFEEDLIGFEEKVFEITNKFVKYYNMFIPVHGLEFYTKEAMNEEGIEDLGVTTVDFEEIKDFYIDAFEDISDMLIILIAYNNLINRDDFQVMDQEVNQQIKSIDDYRHMKSKGRKLEFIESPEAFNNLFFSKISNRLRNAIVHRSYTYDVNNQLITYYPSGKINKGEKETLFLTEFVQECISLMKSVVLLGELTYQTRKTLLVKKVNFVRTLKDYFPSETNYKEDAHKPNIYIKKAKKEKVKKKERKRAKKSRRVNRR